MNICEMKSCHNRKKLWSKNSNVVIFFVVVHFNIWICNPTCCSKSSANAKKLIPWSFHRRMYSSSMMVSKVSMMVLIVSTSDVVMLGDSKIWQPPHVYVRGGLAGALSPFQLGRHTHTHGSLRNFAVSPEKMSSSLTFMNSFTVVIYTPWF